MRDGDLKYLRIGGKEFLFNVVDDQHERADLKTLRAGDFARLKSDYDAWNRGMLPYPDGMFSENPKVVPGFADRY